MTFIEEHAHNRAAICADSGTRVPLDAKEVKNLDV